METEDWRSEGTFYSRSGSTTSKNRFNKLYLYGYSIVLGLGSFQCGIGLLYCIRAFYGNIWIHWWRGGKARQKAREIDLSSAYSYWSYNRNNLSTVFGMRGNIKTIDRQLWET